MQTRPNSPASQLFSTWLPASPSGAVIWPARPQFELAAAADPPYQTGRLNLARGLLSWMMAGTAVLAHQDVGRAQALALECLEDMRRWAGPSERAVVILQQLAYVQGAYAEVIRLGSPPGAGGTALEREATDGEVTVLAAQAAAAMGNRELAASFGAQTTDPAAAAYIGVVAADPSTGLPPSRPPGATPSLRPPPPTSKPAAPYTSWPQSAS
jgi:hypothetical protein